MVGWSPFLGRSPSNYNLFYLAQIWLPKILTRQEFDFQNIVNEVIEVDELDEGDITVYLDPSCIAHFKEARRLE